ncbi:acyltransferase domain-containing protein [Hazenella coriacea]|uniref:Bacillaene synthase trans-acting acyltransferase n=1 Tax=Hazenella coriacea TaxID=1179467 RepID=A0A4R3L408_9BACL|nr:acyltransferase domain-containing protein [Hazenella coriacea]TCS93655.1 bacillaene synthase trans-acting acyltransferase [Hazenella coriacea]
MNRPIVFMFSGQGSQYYQMGKELFNNNAVFRNSMLKIDSIIFQQIGKSVVDEIYHPRKRMNDQFDRTLFTHPAIFMVEYSLCQVLLEMDIVPDYVLGSSLGEFTSVAISDMMDLEDLVECIVEQAVIFENSCEKGSMIAIIDNPSLYDETPQLFENSELTSINYRSHFVISGDHKALQLVLQFLKENNIIHQLLPVSYGFHSSLIDPAERAYKDFIKMKNFKTPLIPLISCLQGERVTEVDRFFLWDVVRKPIQFQKAIQYLESRHECTYLDLGPSGTLSNFLKQNLSIKSRQRCYSIMTPFNQELKYLKIIEESFRDHTR